MQILLIDDDSNVLKQIEEALRHSNIGITCSFAESCEQGLALLRLNHFDLVLVDIRFPEAMDGLTLIKTLRNSKMNIPIIVLSGTSEIQEKIRALDLGADDYILKPFDRSELLARIKRHIFRQNNHLQSIFSIGPLTLDMETKVVTIQDPAGVPQPVKLTNKEYQLLEFLLLKKGVTMSKINLFNHLYRGYSTNPDIKIIDVVMCKIRQKIQAFTNEELIITAWGRGYTIPNEITPLQDKKPSAGITAGAKTQVENKVEKKTVFKDVIPCAAA